MSTAKQTSPAQPMDATAAARIESATARKTGGQVPANTFTARAKSAAARNAKGK